MYCWTFVGRLDISSEQIAVLTIEGWSVSMRIDNYGARWILGSSLRMEACMC
jgi:hypothetical protein